MKKNDIRTMVVLGVLLALAHLLIFLLPFPKGVIFWFSYVILLVAFCVAAASIALAFRDNHSIDSRFYGIPIAKVGIMYLAVQAVLTLAFMALGRTLPFWVVLLVDSLLLGAAVLGLVAQDVVRDHALDLDIRLEQNVSVIRALQSTMSMLPGQCDNLECRAAVAKLSEELRYSDPVSSPDLAAIETGLGNSIDDLQRAVQEHNDDAIMALCEQTRNLLLERNRQCKLSKRSR